MRGLHGKAAIVTGAAQGIGKAIAERLTEEGVRVLWADINEEKVQQAQRATGKGIAIQVPFVDVYHFTGQGVCIVISLLSVWEDLRFNRNAG